MCCDYCSRCLGYSLRLLCFSANKGDGLAALKHPRSRIKGKSNGFSNKNTNKNTGDKLHLKIAIQPENLKKGQRETNNEKKNEE